jgi:hypothetical protein
VKSGRDEREATGNNQATEGYLNVTRGVMGKFANSTVDPFQDHASSGADGDDGDDQRSARRATGHLSHPHFRQSVGRQQPPPAGAGVRHRSEPGAKTGWRTHRTVYLFLFARNGSDGHRDSQGLILWVGRQGYDRLPEFRDNPASPFAAREEVGIGNDDPRQNVIHC